MPHVGDLRYCRIINVCLCQPTFDKKRVIYRLNLKVSFYEFFISFLIITLQQQKDVCIVVLFSCISDFHAFRIFFKSFPYAFQTGVIGVLRFKEVKKLPSERQCFHVIKDKIAFQIENQSKIITIIECIISGNICIYITHST